MKFFRFFISKYFLKHLAIAILISIAIIFLTFWGLNMYTDHGVAYRVPSFIGLQGEEIKDLAEKKDLRVKIIDSVFVENIAPGAVVEQNPEIDAKVKKNRTIFLTINTQAPEMVGMPKLTDISARQAEAILSANNLNLGEIIPVPSEYRNLVIDQLYMGEPIRVGMQIPRNSNIDLVVGEGLSSETTPIPDLKGLRLDEAKEILKNRTLNLGAVVFDSAVVDREDSATALIRHQVPTFEKTKLINLGTSINIWLTNDSLYYLTDSLSLDGY